MAEPFDEWSRRLRASDATACTELFRALHAPLLRYAAQLVGRETEAYDVVQKAFIKLWQHRERLDPDQSLRAYLYQIVRNTALNHKRGEKRRRDAHATAAASDGHVRQGASAPQALQARELRTHVRTWIDELPPKRREAFRLSRFEGLSHAEIADVMELVPRTVTNHIMLALRDLRDHLQAYEAEEANH